MSVVSVNLFDRKKEIGVYYCLGCEKSFLTRLYTFEVLILNSISAISGIFLGMIVRLFINSIGITTEDPGMQLVFGGSRFTLGFNINSSLYLLGLIVILSVVTSLIVLRNCLNVRPIEAVRESE
jgi:ABC-type lipoprotein release transport system permease subunit